MTIVSVKEGQRKVLRGSGVASAGPGCCNMHPSLRVVPFVIIIRAPLGRRRSSRHHFSEAVRLRTTAARLLHYQDGPAAEGQGHRQRPQEGQPSLCRPEPAAAGVSFSFADDAFRQPGQHRDDEAETGGLIKDATPCFAEFGRHKGPLPLTGASLEFPATSTLRVDGLGGQRRERRRGAAGVPVERGHGHDAAAYCLSHGQYAQYVAWSGQRDRGRGRCRSLDRR